MPSKSLADLLAILDFVRREPLPRAVMDQDLILCVNYLGCGFKFATKIIVDIFFNNKQAVK